MFYPPSAVCAEHEKSNAGNPISLRLRPLISPLLVISFKGPLTLLTVFEIHIYIPLKEQKNGETKVK